MRCLCWFLFLFLPLLAQGREANKETAILLDMYQGRVEAELSLPTATLEQALGRPLGSAAEIESARPDLAAYFQTHLNFTTTDGQPLETELGDVQNIAPEAVQLALFFYPPEGKVPVTFVVSGDLLIHEMMGHRLRFLLRRDAAEMRWGLEAPQSLGMIDYYHKELTIEREPLPPVDRGFAAFVNALQLLTASGLPLLYFLLLLLPAVLASPGKTTSVFLRAGAATVAFGVGIGLALLTGVQGNSTILTVGMIGGLLVTAFFAWRPPGLPPQMGCALGVGFLIGVCWNGFWLLPDAAGGEPSALLLIAAMLFPALGLIMLLALPTLLLTARQIAPNHARPIAAFCGVFVALLVLTGFLRPG